MLLFYSTETPGLSVLRREGLEPSDGETVWLWTSLAAAQEAGSGRVLVVDTATLDLGGEDVPPRADDARIPVAAVPPGAFLNLDPYLPPKPITAGGGYVARPGRGEPEVLLIFRRGVWDLPKGKQDAGETVEACALREVREELGITTLHRVCPLGTTMHGYAQQGRYLVKTTHWFLMRTPETRFTPEAREGIDEVAWVPWSEAEQQVGFATLRRHMQRVGTRVRAAIYQQRIDDGG